MNEYYINACRTRDPCWKGKSEVAEPNSHCFWGRDSVHTGERRVPCVPLTSLMDSPPWMTQKWLSLLGSPHPYFSPQPITSFLARKPSVFASPPKAKGLNLPGPSLAKLKNKSIPPSPILASEKENQLLGRCQSCVFNWYPDSLTFQLKNLSLISFLF